MRTKTNTLKNALLRGLSQSTGFRRRYTRWCLTAYSSPSSSTSSSNMAGTDMHVPMTMYQTSTVRCSIPNLRKLPLLAPLTAPAQSALHHIIDPNYIVNRSLHSSYIGEPFPEVDLAWRNLVDRKLLPSPLPLSQLRSSHTNTLPNSNIPLPYRRRGPRRRHAHHRPHHPRKRRPHGCPSRIPPTALPPPFAPLLIPRTLLSQLQKR